MSNEKNVYVFGAKWGNGGISYEEKCVNDKIVFINAINDTKKNYTNIVKRIEVDDIILLRGNHKRLIGRANSKAREENALSEQPLFISENELNKYGIPIKEKLLYVTVKEWYEIPKDKLDKIKFGISRVLNIHKYKTISNEIINKIESEQKGEKMEKEIITLLNNNYNLILTGAPGTGKTYLAKEIVKTLIKGNRIGIQKEQLEEDINNQMGFVQFHPSYDYTDFVEGIRPKKDSNGFERVDGIFKDFCKRAVKNINDSNKTKEVIATEEIVKKYLLQFCEEINEHLETNDGDGYGINGVGGKPCAPIKYIDIDSDTNQIKIKIGTKTKSHNIVRPIDMMIQYYIKFEEYIKEKATDSTKKYELFLKYFSNMKGRTAYLHGFLNAFYEKYSSVINSEMGKTQEHNTIERKDFYFIIDEINRGDLNKILGELFYSLDMGYRGEKGKVKTQYQNMIEDGDIFQDGFYIPENVYIIGTMNDIDRSVDSMDFAIRRRFAWKEITAEETAESILSKLDNKDEIINRMTNLNNAISKTEGLNSMYHIGASYFLKLEKYDYDYEKLWDNHLKGLLYEYLRGKKDIANLIEKLKEAYNLKQKENNG